MALRSSSDLMAWNFPGSWTAWCEGWPGSTWGWSRWATYYWPGRAQWAGTADLSATSGHLRKTSPGKHLFFRQEPPLWNKQGPWRPWPCGCEYSERTRPRAAWLCQVQRDLWPWWGDVENGNDDNDVSTICVFVWWPFGIADDQHRSSQRLERPEKKYVPHWHWVLEVFVFSVHIIIIIIFVTIIIDQTF